MSCGGCCMDCGSDKHCDYYQTSCKKCHMSFCGYCGNVCLECEKNFICSCEKSQICSCEKSQICLECVLTFLLNKTNLTQEQVLAEIRKNK